VADLWDLFPAAFLLAWAAYNWVCYKYPGAVPNPFGLPEEGEWEPDEDGEDESMTGGEYVIAKDEDTFSEFEPHEGAVAQLGLDRRDTEERERFDVKDVPLSRNERSILRRAVAEYLDKAGQIRGCSWTLTRPNTLKSWPRRPRSQSITRRGARRSWSAPARTR
jgi:hypothetical protein